ncbi:hypothetical protein SV7mr_52820 [Stieleria bergensis]|uniref:Transposase IS200-like domain-containing protein n=1 Tax=Stieleria bergensis TaxID=2528025 RepID=A0A517T325_9BACT|nr:hypothetical protein SV7mr_52820 [Planctomycetes bacterium SV_7m_r]
MCRDPRSEVLDPHQVEAVHLYNRTIDGLYLLGKNPDTGEDFSYRQGWLVDKMNQLFAHLCIELLSYGVLSNHYHLNVRTRPDIAASLTDRQVAERWLSALSGQPDKDGNFKQPSEQAIEMLMANKEKLEKCRAELSDCSHLMKQLNQYLAQRANYEDGRRGSFWAGRYGSTRLVDDAALLACTVYIDLNRIRAGLVISHLTSIAVGRWGTGSQRSCERSTKRIRLRRRRWLVGTALICERRVRIVAGCYRSWSLTRRKMR